MRPARTALRPPPNRPATNVSSRARLSPSMSLSRLLSETPSVPRITRRSEASERSSRSRMHSSSSPSVGPSSISLINRTFCAGSRSKLAIARRALLDPEQDAEGLEDVAALDDGPAPAAAPGLLHDVCKLVREQAPAGRARGIEPSRAEDDVLADRERGGVDAGGGCGGAGVVGPR